MALFGVGNAVTFLNAVAFLMDGASRENGQPTQKKCHFFQKKMALLPKKGGMFLRISIINDFHFSEEWLHFFKKMAALFEVNDASFIQNHHPAHLVSEVVGYGSHNRTLWAWWLGIM